MASSLNSLVGPALNSLSQYQQGLQQRFAQASSGNRLVNASIDPAGIAIYNALTNQANGFDQGSYNVQDAADAINVAQGALTNTSAALERINTLAIQATNDFISPQQRQALQVEANALVQQINTNASDTNFNGLPLLNGQFSGVTPAAPAAATTTSNAILGGGGNLTQTVTPSAASVSGTIQVAVVDTGGGASGAQITFTDSATGVVTVVATVAQNSTTAVNGTNVTVGNFSAADIGANATTQVTAASAGSNAQTLNVQSGANQGSSVQVSLANGTSSGIGIQNIDFSTSANATNAQGQIAQAFAAVTGAQARLGAQTNSLSADLQNNATASLNLRNSASSIGDANQTSLASEIASLVLKQQISIATINSANVAYGHLNRFLNVGA
jgi:flagellin